MEYGTGAIMAVPGHDERDFEFATVFGLPIVRVVASSDEAHDADHAARRGVHGDATARIVINSGAVRRPARRRSEASDHGRGSTTTAQAKPVVNYRLHDWCISRQRYWGPPIPIIYCETCGTVPVPEKDLPVELPFVEDFKPDDTGVSPLARVEEWYRVPCPTVRQTGAPRDRRVGHVPRQRVVLPALSEHRDRRRAVRRRRSRRSGCRWTPTSAATSTRCCTCCTRAS